MLIVILVICIGLLATSYCFDKHYSTSDVGFGCAIAGTIGIIVWLVAFLIVLAWFCGTNTIPAKIDVLTEQNQKIEHQVNAIAENYLDHETESYDRLTPDNAEFFAIAYPQLASNETVKKQMELYIENNNKITELKLEQCNASVYRRWLCFGK